MVVIVELGAGPFQKAVVVKQLQAPEKLLRTRSRERDDLGRTQKTVPVDQPDDDAVALGQLNGRNRTGACEPGKAG